MNKKVLTVVLILALLPLTGAAQIITELPQKTELENFTSTIHDGAGFVNISHFVAMEDHPYWNHDKWVTPNGAYYESFYYNNTSAPLGYTSVYYDDYGNKLPAKCRIVLKLVEPYYGLNVTEEICEDNVTHDTPLNNTTENETLGPIEKVNKTPKSKFSASFYNGESEEEANVSASFNEENESSWLDILTDIWNAIHGGN